MHGRNKRISLLRVSVREFEIFFLSDNENSDDKNITF